MDVFEIDPLKDPRWDNFVAVAPSSSIFHRSEWLQALNLTYGYEPFALSSCNETSPLTNAILCCRIRSRLTGNRIVSLPFSDHCEPLVDGNGDSAALIDFLKSTLNRKKWRYFEVRPVSTLPWDELMPTVSSTYFLHSLDLRSSEEHLFKNFHKDCVQRRIRRAERAPLRYEEGSSEILLDYFYRLMMYTRRKHGLPPQPMKWFRSLVSSFRKDLKIRVALKDNIPVASILTISHRKTMTYKYGCSDPQFQNLGGTAFLFWKTILEAKEKGLEQFDLGRSDVDNAGLIAYKEHWGASRSLLNYRRFPSGSATAEEKGWASWALKRLVAVAPDASLIKLGTFLYRHIG